MPKDLHTTQFAGIHLAGVNSQRTTLVTLTGHPLKKSLKLDGLYEKIGHFGNLFSDDRLIEILRLAGPLERVFVDCPISVPPCVACTRPVCPGVDACEDLSVAYMMAIVQNLSSRQRRRRGSVNPQVQRLWDVYRLSRRDPEYFEPTYSSNNSSQAIRARSLQKRLHLAMPEIKLEETSVVLSLVRLAVALDLDELEIRQYRNFSRGREVREQVIHALEKNHWLQPLPSDKKQSFLQSVDAFEALTTALIAALVHVGLEEKCPKDFELKHEWVYRPKLVSDIPEYGGRSKEE